ncbi:MAG: protease [Candidatus Aenigmatarchaeota archaeon]|nr:MAG: protease [Candidatus Aenigmarchaeota archaeon]
MIDMFLLFAVLTGILLGVGWILGGITGMGIALVFSFTMNLFSYLYSDKIVLSIYRAKPFKNSRIEAMIENLSHEAKIPKPRLYIIEDETPNAFATGRSPQRSVIAITRGLLKLEEDEIETVLGHEIAHIKRRDVLTSTVAAVIAGAISYLAQIGYWSFYLGDKRDSGNLLGLVLVIILAPVAALLVRMAISRSMEYRADRYSALLTKKPRSLASALKKISHMVEQRPIRGPAATSHLWIVNPFRRDWFTGLFSTHPPIEDRIRRLMEMEE